MTRYLRALAAAAALLGLLIGWPIALAFLFGNPLHGWAAYTAGDLSNSVVIDVLAIAAWAAWAWFASLVAGEIRSQVSGLTRPPMPGVPLTPQHLAHTLVAALFLVVPATPVLTAGAAPASFTTPAIIHTISTAKNTGEQTHSPLTRNAGWASAPSPTAPPAQPAGTSSSQGNRLTLVSPQLTQTYVVRPDGPHTWWALAQDVLGDGQHWRELWDLNAGTTQTDGHVMVVPGQLRNGWSIRLPAPSPDTGARAQETLETANHEDAGEHTVPVFAAGTGAGLLAGLMLRELAFRRRRRFAYRRPGRTITTTPPALTGLERAVTRRGADSAVDVDWLDQALRALAGQILARGERLPDVAAARLDADALDLLLHPRAGQSRGRRARIDPPPPWHTDPATGRWRLLRTDSPTAPGRQDTADPAPFAPFPALAGLGRGADGSTWLVDLESAGILTLLGHPDPGLDLARYLAAELATSTWAENLRITLIGLGPDITGLNPDRLLCAPDPVAALRHLHAHVQGTRAFLDEIELTSTLDGRALDVAGDSWFPHILIINRAVAPAGSPEAGALDALLDTMRARPGRAGIAVVLTGPAWSGDGQDADEAELDPGTGQPASAGLRLRVGADGRARVPLLDQTVTVNQLPASHGVRLADLLGSGHDLQDQPMPPARGRQPWDALADAAGAPRPEYTLRGPTVTAKPTARPDTVLAQSPGELLATTATTVPDIAALAPRISEPVRAAVHDADPDLDTDLEAWYDPTTVRPRLSVLGPVRVRAQGPLPAKRAREEWHTEVVAYLAAHPRGVTAEQLSVDLWPEGTKPRPRQTMYDVRVWLGTNPLTGSDYVPSAKDNTPNGTGRYQIDGLLTDADLFRRLRLRGTTHGPHGITDLETALTLVTGQPFDGRRRGGYDWLIDTPLDIEYTAMIIDVAHLVATHHLATARPDLAAKAATIALTAGSTDDIPLLDLIAAGDAQGHHARATSLIRQILTNNDAEILEDLAPRTAAVLLRRQRLHRAG